MSDLNVRSVKVGQKLMLYPFLSGLLLAAVSLRMKDISDATHIQMNDLMSVENILSAALVTITLVGIYKACQGLGYSRTKTWSLVVVYLLMPLAGWIFAPAILGQLVVLLVVNAKATGALRTAGHRVGLFGVA